MNMLGDLNEKYDGLCEKMDALTAALHEFPRNDQTHSQQLREWERFVLHDALTLASGVGALGVAGSQAPAANGWEAYVERITLLVGGSSSGAVGAVFHASQGPTSCIDIIPLVVAVVVNTVTYYGNAANYSSPAYFRDGAALIVTVTGADTTAGTQAVMRVEGRRREV